MKKLLMIVAVLTVLLSAVSVANAEEMELKSVDTILSEIQQEQNVNSTDQINPDEVSQAKLEELGDSAMEAMIGNTDTHEQMDVRLGGEGSASLAAFHTRLGYNYLVGYPNGMMSLMTSGMMGANGSGANYDWNGMMGNNNFRGNNGMMGYIGWGGILIGLVVLLLLLATVLFFVIRAIGRKPSGSSNKSPLDVLKMRFASGEITQEEYEKMVEHLRN